MSDFETEVREAMASTAREIRARVTELEKAAMAWDRAEREGTLGGPTIVDDRPRDPVLNRPITFRATVSINGKAPWDPGGRVIDRDFIPTDPWGNRR